jgi:ketosteroid isomerase-like protein
MKLSDWIERYGRAWEQADEKSIVTLFTEDALYRSSPFREPHVGHDQIRTYWRRATGRQHGARVRMGRPLVDGDRVTVEWWTTMIEHGQEVTFPGCLLLRLGPDGRCRELREYWHLAPGRHEPFAGWAG